MALLVNYPFCGILIFGLWRFRNSPDLTSRNLQATDNGQPVRIKGRTF